MGRNPTFDGLEEHLEVHLMDYGGPDFYGAPLEVFFHDRIREEKRFPDEAALTARIGRDVAAARRLLAPGPGVDSWWPPPKMPGSRVLSEAERRRGSPGRDRVGG
jgi:hypothetical protein